jgi:hypothetical protein
MPEGAYEVLGRRDEALAGLIARHGTLNPFVWRELDDADERSRHREGVSPLVRKRKCSPVGPSVLSG